MCHDGTAALSARFMCGFGFRCVLMPLSLPNTSVLQMEACPFTPPNHTSYYMTAQALLKAGRHGLAAEVAQRGIQQRGDKSAALKHLVAELSRTLLSGSSKSTANETGHHGGNRFMQATGKGMAVV